MTFITETSGFYKLYKADGNVVFKVRLDDAENIRKFDNLFLVMQNSVE